MTPGINFALPNNYDKPWLRQTSPWLNGSYKSNFTNWSGWSNWSGAQTTSSSNSPEQAKKTEPVLNLTNKEVKTLKKEQKAILDKGSREMHGSLGTSLAMGSVFCIGTVKNCAQVKKNSDITKMFFEYNNVAKKAKYETLWKDAPIAMSDAQKQMSKANRKYIAEFNRLSKKGLSTAALDDDYLKLIIRMEEALKTGDAQKVAEATERIRSANSVSYKKLRKINKKKRYTVTKETLARKANISNVKAVKGNKLISHAGGKLGVGMGLASGLFMLGADYSKIKEAYEIDAETGNKQLGQSCTKAAGMMVGYTAGDAIGRKAATKLLSKSVSKIAAKVAAKGAGRLIGMAVGSIVPGIGTIAGFAIGTALDFAISKWVVPAIWGDSDVVDKKKIDKQNKKDDLANIYTNYKNGMQISDEALKILEKNPEYCLAIEKQLQESNAA